jgi:hypothetical protein
MMRPAHPPNAAATTAAAAAAAKKTVRLPDEPQQITQQQQVGDGAPPARKAASTGGGGGTINNGHRSARGVTMLDILSPDEFEALQRQQAIEALLKKKNSVTLALPEEPSAPLTHRLQPSVSGVWVPPARTSDAYRASVWPDGQEYLELDENGMPLSSQRTDEQSGMTVADNNNGDNTNNGADDGQLPSVSEDGVTTVPAPGGGFTKEAVPRLSTVRRTHVKSALSTDLDEFRAIPQRHFQPTGVTGGETHVIPSLPLNQPNPYQC